MGLIGQQVRDGEADVRLVGGQVGDGQADVGLVCKQKEMDRQVWG